MEDKMSDLVKRTQNLTFSHRRNNYRPGMSSDGEEDEPTSNIPNPDYLSIIKDDSAFLKIKKLNFPLDDELTSEKLGYPLGVAYDEILETWLVVDRRYNKILSFMMAEGSDPKLEITETPQLKNPSAVIVYKEGKSVAVLCSEEEKSRYIIYIYDLKKQFISRFASYDEKKYDIRYQLRGLAKSNNGNILSLELVFRGSKKLKLINKQLGSKSFDIRGAVNPSFIASYKDTVAVSDLGVNKVFIYQVDDSNWDNVQFKSIRTINTESSLPPSLMANESGFVFVAGMVFDVNGFLMIGDAKGHCIKLYDIEYEFLHRVSSDFPLPFMSSFCINKKGEMMILDVHAPKKLCWAKLTSVEDILPWVPPSPQHNNYRNDRNFQRFQPRHQNYH